MRVSPRDWKPGCGLKGDGSGQRTTTRLENPKRSSFRVVLSLSLKWGLRLRDVGLPFRGVEGETGDIHVLPFRSGMTGTPHRRSKIRTERVSGRCAGRDRRGDAHYLKRDLVPKK